MMIMMMMMVVVVMMMMSVCDLRPVVWFARRKQPRWYSAGFLGGGFDVQFHSVFWVSLTTWKTWVDPAWEKRDALKPYYANCPIWGILRYFESMINLETHQLPWRILWLRQQCAKRLCCISRRRGVAGAVWSGASEEGTFIPFLSLGVYTRPSCSPIAICKGHPGNCSRPSRL